MSLYLSTELRGLLREAVKKRNPRLLNLVEELDDIDLTNVERDELRDVVADEFMETGLQDDDQPNRRGLLLEDLIGKLRNP